MRFVTWKSLSNDSHHFIFPQLFNHNFIFGLIHPTEEGTAFITQLFNLSIINVIRIVIHEWRIWKQKNTVRVINRCEWWMECYCYYGSCSKVYVTLRKNLIGLDWLCGFCYIIAEDLLLNYVLNEPNLILF